MRQTISVESNSITHWYTQRQAASFCCVCACVCCCCCVWVCFVFLLSVNCWYEADESMSKNKERRLPSALSAGWKTLLTPRPQPPPPPLAFRTSIHHARPPPPPPAGFQSSQNQNRCGWIWASTQWPCWRPQGSIPGRSWKLCRRQGVGLGGWGGRATGTAGITWSSLFSSLSKMKCNIHNMHILQLNSIQCFATVAAACLFCWRCFRFGADAQ